MPLISAAQTPLVGVAPPVPTGSPLDVPPIVQGDRPWWLEGAEVTPAEHITNQPAAQNIDDGITPKPRHPMPPPAAFSGSACNFNVWCGDNIFSPDYSSTQVLLGAYTNSHEGTGNKELNYIPLTFRTGWMLTAPDHQDSILAGNWECLCDLTVAKIVSGYGRCMLGPSVYLRRNFVSEEATLVPYSQIGVGLLFTDAHAEGGQNDLRNVCVTQFSAQLGLRYFITDRVSLDVEGGYQHFTTSSTPFIRGIGGFGAQVGFTYHFFSGGK
jgi:hypothetical protein